MKKSILLIKFILIINFIYAQSNVPILERKITVKIVNQTMGKALNIISETAKFNFSYSTQIVKVNKMVTIHAENRTVREILDQLFNRELNYQQIGNHLVLQKKIVPKNTNRIQNSNKPQSRYDLIVSGYMRNVQSGDGIDNASIYHKPSLANTISGDFGYYKISLSSKTPEFELQIRREGYRDTSIKLTYDNNGVIECNFNLSPLVFEEEEEEQTEEIVLDDTLIVTPSVNDTVPKTIQDTMENRQPARLAWVDSLSKLKKIKVEDTKLGQWLIGAYQSVISRNIRDSFQRDWQLTFVPPLGTNGSLSGLVDNKFSFNLLMGYNGGLNGVEFGGLVNFIRKDVVGAQFAGLGNIVGRNTNGAQFAGLFNHNIGIVEGFQAAGFYNYNNDAARGVQLAGFMNVNRGIMDGFQAAGFGNFAGSYSRAVQVAGFINTANEIDGGQIAGFINVARKIRGFQIGIINIADTAEGIAIGIVNFIKNGMHQLELSSNELNHFGLAYRSGTGRFYSIVNINSPLPLSDTGNLISYGFSIGYRAKLSKTFYWNTDIGSRHLTIDFNSDHLNILNRLNTDLEIRLFKGFSVFGGVSLNHMINDTEDPRFESRFEKLVSKPLITDNGRFTQVVWTGWQFGVRLF